MPSEAVQDYLKAIYKIAGGPEGSGAVTTSLIATQLGVSPASVTNMVKKLNDLRLLDHRPYQGVTLTPLGERTALEVIRHHRLLELYLHQALGCSWDAVHQEADRLEHALSEEVEERIDAALGHPTVGAHGEPIPTKEGAMARPSYRRLVDADEGQEATVREVSDHDPELLRYLEREGVVPGTHLTVVERGPFGGGVVVTIGQSTHNLGPEAARHVFVD